MEVALHTGKEGQQLQKKLLRRNGRRRRRGASCVSAVDTAKTKKYCTNISKKGFREKNVGIVSGYSYFLLCI